jgi:hypothetical protein
MFHEIVGNPVLVRRRGRGRGSEPGARSEPRREIGMHDVLRQRLVRKVESLPEEQIYQVMDYIEFLESKYARDLAREATGLQKFAENLEDRLRKRAVNPANIREAFQLIAAADRVLSSVTQAGKELLDELTPTGLLDEGSPQGEGRTPPPPPASPSSAGRDPKGGDGVGPGMPRGGGRGHQGRSDGEG